MSLPGISAAKAGYSVDNFADMAREAASTCDSGEDSVMVAGDVRPDEKGKFVSGTGVGAHRWVVLGKRSEAFGQNNLAMRRAFLAAVKNELGIQDLKDLPKDVRKALCLGDFRLKDGEVTSTRPLTARRVLKVTAELEGGRFPPAQWSGFARSPEPIESSPLNTMAAACALNTSAAVAKTATIENSFSMLQSFLANSCIQVQEDYRIFRRIGQVEP